MTSTTVVRERVSISGDGPRYGEERMFSTRMRIRVMGSRLREGLHEFIVYFGDLGVVGVKGFGDMTVGITNVRRESIKWICFCRGLKGPTEEALDIELVFVFEVIGISSPCRRDHLPNGGE